jgi:hypothetical protein
MILTYGDVSSLGNEQWYTVELRSEKTVESTLRRLGEALPNIFRESGIELFIPLATRDLNTFELATDTYIFARSLNFSALLRLKTVTGVVGLLTEGDSNRPSKVLKIDYSYVAGLIDEARNRFFARAKDVQAGSFVRILDGYTRDWCGTIVNIHDGTACVRVDLKTKLLLVETPVRNLLDLNHVPASLRTFYFANMMLTIDDLAALVAEDISFIEEHASNEDGLAAKQPMKLGRQQTVTALVKKLILAGTIDPQAIALQVLEALKQRSLKRPKNLSIVHGVIKTRLMQDHFLNQDPTIKNYREVIERYGDQYRITIQDLVRLDPGTGLPANTPDHALAA